MKAAIYARTSQLAQSTASQIERCRRYVSSFGGEITGIYDDCGVSGISAPDDREGLQLLMKHATENKFDTLVVTSADRLFRDESLFREFMTGLGQLNIKLAEAKSLK